MPGMCGNGDLEGVRAALGRGEEVNMRGGKYNWTGVMSAAQRGHEAVVELLLQQPGLDVNMTDSSGYTALHLAEQGGHKAVVELLRSSLGWMSM